MKQKQINIILSVVLILILFLIIGVVFYLHRRIEGEIIAVYKERQILTARQIASSLDLYFKAREQSLKVLSSFESIKQKIPKQMEDDINSFYRYVKPCFINSIFVLDERGRVIYSTLREAIGRDCSVYEFWMKSKLSSQDSLVFVPIDTTFKDLFNKPVSLILSPVYDKGKFLGAIAYSVEIDSLINSFLKDTNLGVNLSDLWLITGDKILVFHSAHPEIGLRKAQFEEKSCVQCHVSFNYIDSIYVKNSGVVRYKLKNYPEKFAGFSSLRAINKDLIVVLGIPIEKVRRVIVANVYPIYILFGLTAVLALIYGFIFISNMKDIIRAEEERKQREEREKIQRLYTLLFQNSNDGVYILDPEQGKFIEVNKKFREMLGYTQEELNNLDFMQLVAPESRPLIASRREKISKGVPVPQRYTFTALSKDGRRIEVEVSVSYVRFGEKLYVLGIYRDISEILKQRELYRDLFENLPVGVVIHQDGKIVKCNRKAIEIGGGKDESDIIGKLVFDFVHPDYREIVKERLRKILEEGKEAPPIEERFVKLDGSVIDVRVKASGIMWEGRPAVQVMVEDVTEVKKLERELVQRYREREELLTRFEHILRNIDEGVYFLNNKGIIEFANEKFCEIWGYKSPQDLIGKSIYQFLDEVKNLVDESQISPEEFKNEVLQFIEMRKAVKYPELKFKDGRIVERYAMPIYDLAGNYVGRIAVIRDITEKRQREREVFELQRFEILGQIASGIAHDFNNVLGIIMGMLELIKVKTADKSILSYVESAISASERGAGIARRLLQFSKKKVEEFKPVSVKSLLFDTVKMLEHTIPKTIAIEIGEVDDFVVFGSYGDLQQVILNLALNACDAMPGGGKLAFWVSSVGRDFIEKKFRSVSSDVYAVIAVSDTGFGIGDELREKIFEPFFTTKELGKGTGLGLSIVKNIVTIHGGFIDFESVIGKGTTFYVYLPVYLAEEKETKINRGEERMKKIGAGYKVLIVEDEDSLRVVMRDYLTMLGFSVIEAEDGETALEKFKENRDIKIVFVDYGLPKMVGDELIKRIYSISEDVKFVLVTGFVDVEVKESLPSGTKFIRKPYNLSQIEEVVRGLF